MSPFDDVGHRLHDNAGPQVFLGEVFPIRLDVQIILRGVVQVGNIQVNLSRTEYVLMNIRVLFFGDVFYFKCYFFWCF